MASFAEVIKSLIEKHGGNKSKIARKLGLKEDGRPIWPSQLLGQYERGESEAKMPFYKAWKHAFGEDIEAIIEGKVSITSTDQGSFKHKIIDGEYIGLHKVAWDEFQKTLITNRKVLTSLAKNNTKLADSNNELSRNITELVKRIT